MTENTSPVSVQSAHQASTASSVAELGHAAEIASHASPRTWMVGAAGVVLMTIGIGYTIYKGEVAPPVQSVASTRSTDGVCVKVTTGLQPVPAGFSIRIVHGPTYELDRHGETEILAQYRGSRWELLDGVTVVRTGTVPKEGDANIDLK